MNTLPEFPPRGGGPSTQHPTSELPRRGQPVERPDVDDDLPKRGKPATESKTPPRRPATPTHHVNGCLPVAHYTTEYWAKFTWKVLAHGLKQTKEFIPWPDTRRLWRAHLTPERADFLEKFLPAAPCIGRRPSEN